MGHSIIIIVSLKFFFFFLKGILHQSSCIDTPEQNRLSSVRINIYWKSLVQ